LNKEQNIAVIHHKAPLLSPQNSCSWEIWMKFETHHRNIQ
jgi:hypothetical protein